jgi:hypothetical protein
MDAAHPYNQLLLAFWRQRDRDASWGHRLLVALALIGLATSLYFSRGWWPAVLAGSAVLALASLWMSVISSLLMQNHPHVARFVPGHLRRLREAALAAWLLLSGSGALLLWAFLPRMPSLPATVLLAAGTLAFAAWAIRHWQLWLVVSFGPPVFLGSGLHRSLAPLAAAAGELWAAQPLSLLTLGLMALGVSVTRLFGGGDEAHRAAYISRARMQRAARDGMAGRREGLAAFGRPGEWLNRPFRHATAAWLRHVLATARPDTRSTLQRVEIVLHGQQHWLRQLIAALIGVGVATLCFTVAFTVFGPGLQNNWRHGAYGMAIGLSSMGFNPAFSLPGMLWHSRHEQALLKLLPGMPQGAAQNRAVAGLQLRQTLIAWAVTTLLLALFAWVADDPALMSLAFGALPLSVGCVLRAPARMTAPGASSTAMPVFAFILMGWGLYILHQHAHVPLAAMAGVSVALAAVIGAWRWRMVMRAPQPLPAGRCA